MHVFDMALRGSIEGSSMHDSVRQDKGGGSASDGVSSVASSPTVLLPERPRTENPIFRSSGSGSDTGGGSPLIGDILSI